MQVMGSAPPVKPLFRKISVVPLTTNSPSAFTEESLYRAPNFCSKRALSSAVAEAAIVSITRNGTKRDIEVLRMTTLLSLTCFLARRLWIIQKRGPGRKIAIRHRNVEIISALEQNLCVDDPSHKLLEMVAPQG